MDNIDINKIVVSNKISFGKKDFKYFIGYKDAKKVKPNLTFSFLFLVAFFIKLFQFKTSLPLIHKYRA